MGTNSADLSKDNLLSQIWSISSTLTEEALTAASAKAKLSGFDENRGLVPLSESFINLSSARAVLEDAIDKQKLVQLPITVQKEILGNLETISKSVQGLTSGVDEIANLSAAIEALNTAIWKYGLHNLSDQVLGYQKKLNQLKNQELQVSKALSEIQALRDEAKSAESAVEDIRQKSSDASGLLEQLKQNAGSAATLLEQVKDSETKANALFVTVQQNEKQSGELTAAIKTSNNELISLDASIRKFYGEVDEYRRKIVQTSDEASKLITGSEAKVNQLVEQTNSTVQSTVESLRADSKSSVSDLTSKIETRLSQAHDEFSALQSETTGNLTKVQSDAANQLAATMERMEQTTSKLVEDSAQKLTGLEEQLKNRSEETIEANQKRTAALLEELAGLKGQIREQIQQATGFALFGAFQSRQNEIAKSKRVWIYAIAGLVVVSAIVTAWIAHEAQSYNAHSFAFWVKLSLTIPLGYAITFCTVQYSRERRLEEEYAFKSSISVSLNPYRDLVHSILEKDGQVDASKYTDFVISSVNNVFTSPTDRVFEGDKKPSLTKKTFKEVAEVIGTAAKAAK